MRWFEGKHSAPRPWARAWGTALLLGLGLLHGCGAESVQSESGMGGETHFLAPCDAQCGGEFECVAGVCTVLCEDDVAICGTVSNEASCVEQTTLPAICDVPCSSDAGCEGVGRGYTCQAGACRKLNTAGGATAQDAGTQVATRPCDLSAPLDFEGQAIATRLASLLWDDEPDQELLDAAQAGDLQTREQVVAQAERMLTSDKAQDTLWRFYSSWLAAHPADWAVERPEVEATLQQAFQRETQLFTGALTSSAQGTLRALLTSSTSFIDATLAQHYAVAGAFDDAFVATELDPAQRFGLLTRGYFLWLNPRAPQRGEALRVKLQCAGPAPAPPPDVLPFLPVAATDGTTRQAYEEQLQNAACAACHQMFTFIGFAFEQYDGVGKFRDSENGQVIDSSVHLPEYLPVSGDFAGVAEIAPALAGSAEVERCFAGQWLAHLAGRPLFVEGLDAVAATSAPPTPDAFQLDSESLDVALSCARTGGELHIRRLVATLAASPSALDAALASP